MIGIRTLRWISVIVPTAFVVGFEWTTHSLDRDAVPAWGHGIVALAAVSAAAFAFSTFVFTTISRLEREVRERNRRLALLHAVATEASESLDTEEVAAAIIEEVGPALEADTAGLVLASGEDGEPRLVARYGLPEIALGDRRLGFYDCECRRALTLGQTVVVDAGTCVTVPIKCKGNTIGAIFVARPRSRPFKPDEVELATALGSQVGAVLQNAQVFSKTGAIAVLGERQRVAREVHDGLAQTLSYLSTQLRIVDFLLTSAQQDKARAELEAMMRVIQDAHQDLRQSMTDLRTPLSVGGDLCRTLREYVERFSLRTGLPCSFEGGRDVGDALPPSAEVQLIRIVQEALTNVKRHAPGAEVRLRLWADDHQIHIAIQDSGPGFDPAAVPDSGRFGLLTMKERAESLDGSLAVESRPGAGTRLEITVPFRRAKRTLTVSDNGPGFGLGVGDGATSRASSAQEALPR